MKSKLALLLTILIVLILPSCEEKDDKNPVVTQPPYDYAEEISRECAFIARLQVTDEGPDLGGIREGEIDGSYTYLWDIIQSDNTTESIWVWSYYHRTQDSSTYDTNVANAWTYIESHPGWEEEGTTDPISGYYRVYVSSWGPIATMEYEDSYDDTSHRSYGDTCANYIANNPLNIDLPQASIQNSQVESFAVGSLYLYGQHHNNSFWKQKALEMATAIKTKVESAPEQYLASSRWAMSGGAIMWGLLNSYFLEYPDQAEAWVNEYAPYLSDYEAPNEDPAINNWNSSHNAWYALGHLFAYKTTEDDAELATFTNLRQLLMNQDTDSDGGIPSEEGTSSNRDESWTSNYQVYMTFVPGIGYE